MPFSIQYETESFGPFMHPVSATLTDAVGFARTATLSGITVTAHDDPVAPRTVVTSFSATTGEFRFIPWHMIRKVNIDGV